MEWQSAMSAFLEGYQQAQAMKAQKRLAQEDRDLRLRQIQGSEEDRRFRREGQQQDRAGKFIQSLSGEIFNVDDPKVLQQRIAQMQAVAPLVGVRPDVVPSFAPSQATITQRAARKKIDGLLKVYGSLDKLIETPGMHKIRDSDPVGLTVPELMAAAGYAGLDQDGKPVLPPKPQKERPLHTVTTPGPNGPIVKGVTDEELRQGVPAYERPREPRMLGGMDSLYSMTDPSAIADMIVAGEREPDTANLGRPISGAVDTELRKRGYHKANAITDWKAAQKHFATLNGAQQVRMRQAVDNAYHSLDVIDSLADQWDAGKYPVLNKARLVAAKQGLLGPDAQKIATGLDAQIADVTSEFANVYMGGNSPTDHALELAAKNLNMDWARPQLRALTEQGRKNLTIRKNSITNTRPVGVSESNPYAPPATAPRQPANTPGRGKNPFRP